MSWKLYRGIPTHHNYQKKLATLEEQGQLTFAPGLHDMVVRHDDWCGVFRDQRCDCDPEIEVSTRRPDGHERGGIDA
jgi:hypothetical protein